MSDQYPDGMGSQHTATATASDILIVYTDQWRGDALGCLGSPAITPNLDRLATEGVLFERAFVQSPVCMPSRVSMLTGQYPSRLGITHMGVPVPDDTETIATILGRRGWDTANIGKLHFLPHANRDHASPHPSYGFGTLELSDEPGVYEDDYRAWVRRCAPEALPALSVGLPPAAAIWQELLGAGRGEPSNTSARDDFAALHPFGADSSLTHSAWVATRTVERLESLAPHEHSLTVASFFSPHAPFQPPQEFLDLYDRDSLPLPTLSADERERQAETGPTDEQLRMVQHGYFAAISEVDHHIGRILDALERSGRAEHTVVVFVADHGEWLGDGLRFSKGYPADDPVSRVPLIVRWPGGVVEPGRRVSTIVEALDIVPTLLAAAGIPLPHQLQGRSLYEQLIGADDARVEIAITEHDGWRSVRTPELRYLIHADGSEKLWRVEGNHPDVEVTDDPSFREALADLRRQLLARMLTAERPLPRSWPY